MELPKALAELRDKLADKYFYQYRDPIRTPETLIGVMQIDEHFKSGFTALYANLLSQAGEFDEVRANDHADEYLGDRHRDRAAFAAHSGFKAGMRIQHQQSAGQIAALKAEVARLREGK